MGAWDMFVASTYNAQKGYRIYNENNRLTASINVGWKTKNTLSRTEPLCISHIFTFKCQVH